MNGVDIVPRLHGAFSQDQELVLAMRPQGAWSFDGSVLTVDDASFDVRDHTIGALAEAIGATDLNPNIAHLNGSILVNHAGALYAKQSVLSVLSLALGAALEPARGAIVPALDQLDLSMAEGEWLDVFGDVFGVARAAGETDSAYSQRLRDEVRRTRCSPVSILSNIERLTGERLVLREPWREVFTLSRSRPSGMDRLQGAPTYQYHTMQLVARAGVDWSRVLPIAEADRPAGTLMLEPAVRPWPFWLTMGLDVEVGAGRWRVRACEAVRAGSDVTVAASTRSFAITAGLRRPAGAGGEDRWTGAWDARSWMRTPRRLEMYPPKGYLDDAIDFDHRVTTDDALRMTTDGGVRAIDES